MIFSKHHPLYVLFFLICFSNGLGAQNRVVMDSLRSEANVLVYNNPELAITKALELYALAKDDPSYQVGALLTVANGYAVLKNHEKVLEYAFMADSIAEKNKNYSDQVRALGFIGGQYQRLKLSKKALDYLDQAYAVSLAHPLPDSIQFLQGNILFVKGLIQKDNLGCEFAIEYFTKAAEVFKKNINKKSIYASLAIAYNNIGDCNFEIENYEDARSNYTEAIFYAEKINAIKNVAYSQLGLAKLLSKEGNYEEAITILEDALKSIEDVNDTATNTQILKALSENYLKTGNDDKYNKYTKLYLEEEHKLLEEEKKSLNKVTKKLASENLEKDKIQKDTYTYIFLFIGILLLVLVVVIFQKLVKKRRKIAEHKKEIENSSKKH